VTSPRLAPYLAKRGYSFFPVDAIDYITNLVNQILARRRQHLERRNDFIQMMVDHEEEIKHEEQIDKQEQQQSGTLKKSMKEIFDFILTYCLVLALNDKEILGQALIFLVAGYETTSVLMSFFFYVMATEPVIQEKIYEEIQQEIGDVSEINVRE
jgi:cytochrome P450